MKKILFILPVTFIAIFFMQGLNAHNSEQNSNCAKKNNSNYIPYHTHELDKDEYWVYWAWLRKSKVISSAKRNKLTTGFRPIEARYERWLRQYKARRKWHASFGVGLQSFFGTGDLYFLPQERFIERRMFKDRKRIGEEIYIDSDHKFIPQILFSGDIYYKASKVTTIKFGLSGATLVLGSKKFFSTDDSKDLGYYELNKGYEINFYLSLLRQVNKKWAIGPKIILGGGRFPSKFEFFGHFYPKDLNTHNKVIYQGGAGLELLFNLHKNSNLAFSVVYVHTPIKHLGQPIPASNERLKKLGEDPNNPIRKFIGVRNIRIDTTPIFLMSASLNYKF